MKPNDTTHTDEKKWCAYCGVWSDHQSGYCVRLLRDREEVLSAQLAASQAEVERLKAMVMECARISDCQLLAEVKSEIK